LKSLRGFSRVWDRMTLYLPIILMGLLALGTYWLARNTPSLAGASGMQRAPVHEPDYFLRDFSVKTFDAKGRLTSEIHGTEARHYPDTDTTEIDEPRIRQYNERGALTLATARSAISNGDGSEVQLIGDAVVTRTTPQTGPDPVPTMEIRSEFLHAFMNSERLRTHKRVTIRRGDDVFEADGLDYDNLDRVLEMEGRVRGVLQPRGAPAGG
jgi:lipopolysaccharide export system protein LptC